MDPGMDGEENTDRIMTGGCLCLYHYHNYHQVGCGHRYTAVLTSQGKVLYWGQLAPEEIDEKATHLTGDAPIDPTLAVTLEELPQLRDRLFLACGPWHLLVANFRKASSQDDSD